VRLPPNKPQVSFLGGFDSEQRIDSAVVAMSSSAITGWFTLGAALGAVLLTSLLTWVGEDRRRRAADMAQWRDKGADVLGEVREFMLDVHPHRVTFNINFDTAQETIDRLTARWDELRSPMSRLAVGHPAARARELAAKISVGAYNTLIATRWAVVNHVRHADYKDDVDRSLEAWTETDANMDALREALHGK
jgi:hypothetical protein